jgi:peptide deformylase
MIVTDEAQLRLPCEDVKIEEVDSLREELEKELDRLQKIRPGIGLAAPQIGIQKKMAIVRLISGITQYKLDLVNPIITNAYDSRIIKGEGCLSFPNTYVETIRYNEIYVTNNLVSPFSFIATGMLAIACQHEIDHLYGKLIIDFKKEK